MNNKDFENQTLEENPFKEENDNREHLIAKSTQTPHHSSDEGPDEDRELQNWNEIPSSSNTETFWPYIRANFFRESLNFYKVIFYN